MRDGVGRVSREVISSVRAPLNTFAQPFMSWEQFQQNFSKISAKFCLHASNKKFNTQNKE
jgi:hypothetical protein